MKSWLMIVFFSLAGLYHLQAQNKGIQFSGEMGLYGDFYHLQSDTEGAIKARRPSAVGRMLISATLSYKQFSLPFSLMVTQGQQSVVYPTIPNRNWFQYIRDPANRIGIAPKYKWIELQLGTQVPQYSELSLGDIPIFGAGLNLTPGWFRFSVFSGTTQWAIEEDTVNHIQGYYARKMHAAKIGIGKETSSHFYLIGTLMEDDTSSLKVKPLLSLPQKGLLTSIDYRIQLTKNIYVKGEAALSAFTRDTRSAIVDSLIPEIKIPFDLFHIQQTSRFDYASVFTLSKTGKIFSLNLTGKYIGDGFVPIGYPMMQTDRMDILISPSFNLFKSNVQFSGSIGTRLNNLSGLKAATTYQSLGNADLTIQFTERFSMSGNYSNFDYRNRITNDTLRIQMVTNSWSVSPVYMLSNSKNSQVFTIVYSQNVFTDYNTISGASNGNNSFNMLFSWMLTKISIPFNCQVSFSYFENSISTGTFITRTANSSVGYKFFKKKMHTTAGFTFNQLIDQSPQMSSQLMGTCGMKYQFNKKLAASINGSVNLFTYGSEKPGISFVESMLRTSITSKF